MSDSWHVLGDYLGACGFVTAIVVAAWYRRCAITAEANEAKLEQALREVLAEPKTPRSA